MKIKQKFYNKHYPRDMLNISNRYDTFLSIIKELMPKKFLDIGCNNGSFARAVKDETKCQAYGVDIVKKSVSLARKKQVKAYQIDIDSQKLPFKNKFFDCIFCGDVIEHLFSPDHLLEEIYRVLDKNGVLLLTTPNLASWFNRISLLFGFQPIFTDISLKYSYGYLWKMTPMGHLRLYTLRALKKLVEAHHLKILYAKGIGINFKIGFGKTHPFIAGFANSIFKNPSISSGILLVAQK